MRLNLSDARSINQQLSFLRDFSSPMWDSARVADVFYVKGRIGWRGLRRSDFTVDGPYLITGMHISGGRVRWEECFHIPETKFNESPEIIVQEGDIVITKDGTIGKVAFIDSLPGPASLNSHLFLVRPKTKIINRNFAYHVFSSFLFEKFVDEQSSGSTLTGLPESRFLNFCFTLPPLHEQLSIATILDTVDEAIAKTEAVIAKLKQVRAGLLHDLLARGLDENGQLRDPIAHPEQFQDSPLGRIPKEWEISRLIDASLKVADRDHTTPVYLSQGVRMVSPTQFVGEDEIDFESCPLISIEAHLENRRKTDVKVDDVIIHRIGAGLGRVRLVKNGMPEFSILHSLAMIRPKPHQLLSRFLYWAMQLDVVQLQMGLGTQSIGVPDLGLDKIGGVLLPIPGLPEQVCISDVLDQTAENLGAELAILAKLERLKSGLMNDLLTGCVRVPEGIAVTG